MDIPRHILHVLFQSPTFPLVQHHTESYDDMIETGIPRFIKNSNPHELEFSDGRRIRTFIGGKNGVVDFRPPTDERGDAILPHTCRLDNLSYDLSMYADILIEYEVAGTTTQKEFKDVFLGSFPLMLRSKLCHLRRISPEKTGECEFDVGGYFVVEGAEKVLLTQESLGNNMFYVGRRTPKPTKLDESSYETTLKVNVDSVKETIVGLKAVSEDGTKGPWSHYLVFPVERQWPETDQDFQRAGPMLGDNQRVMLITLPGFIDPVPVVFVFATLGISSHKAMYDLILTGVPENDRLAYDKVLTQMFLSVGTSDPMETLVRSTKRKAISEVIENIHVKMFPQIEQGTLRQKAYALAYMVRIGLDVEIGRTEPSDRDSIQFKRFSTPGDLCFQEFRRAFRDTSNAMTLEMDKRVQYEQKTYEGAKLSALVSIETLNRFWRQYMIGSSFIKAFKGKWGDVAGIAQPLGRLSFVDTLSHMRKTSLQIDPSMNSAPPRRLYASQFGFFCPIDSPDGSSIGYTKALTTLARISNATPAKILNEFLANHTHTTMLHKIHPMEWKNEWTPIYVNAERWGVSTENTKQLVKDLIDARRKKRLGQDISIAWDVQRNVLYVACDAGRPLRPVYHEGIKEEDVRKIKTWSEFCDLVDYVDAMETQVSMFSLVPFHPELRSEIHMTFTMSAVANLNPYADHNPATRNSFAIAQQKQACAIYHTKPQLRFDTFASLLCSPQTPLSHTWLYSEMMRCIPHGFNALVAVTTYGGHNQEDSVILNDGSLRRGMFGTLVYHTYDIAEEMKDVQTQTHAAFSNVLTDHTDIQRKENASYEQLDAFGVIKLNAEVTDETVLVGIAVPMMDAMGKLVRHTDGSIMAKKGQTGRVDGIYQYTQPNGLRGVKIRIVEYRSPDLGDKMASRHSQKGTVGQRLSEEDMPFTASGIRPDIIYNPHGLPTRMTAGQFVESINNKLGLAIGACVDATPFTTTGRVESLHKTMIAHGFEPHGQEILYNGMTGEQMHVDIFMGPVYYQRLKHMVVDKVNSRATGPKTQMTHQPVHGRSKDGGLAIGTMETDAMVSHGISKFINESLMDRSDKTELQFDSDKGRFDTSTKTLFVPYALSVFVKEVEAMHVTMRIETA